MTAQPLVTGPVGIEREEAAALLAKHKVEKLPLVDDDGVLRGLITVKASVKSRKNPLAPRDSEGRLGGGAAAGSSGAAWNGGPAPVEAAAAVPVVARATA